MFILILAHRSKLVFYTSIDNFNFLQNGVYQTSFTSVQSFLTIFLQIYFFAFTLFFHCFVKIIAACGIFWIFFSIFKKDQSGSKLISWESKNMSKYPRFFYHRVYFCQLRWIWLLWPVLNRIFSNNWNLSYSSLQMRIARLVFTISMSYATDFFG